MANPYDIYQQDQSLPPPAVGGNEPTNAPYDPRFEMPYPSPSATPWAQLSQYYTGSIPPNPWASATPVPGGPGGPPSATIQATPTPYDNYAGPSDVLNGTNNPYGGMATPGLDPSMGGMLWTDPGAAGNHYVQNPEGGYYIYDDSWSFVGSIPATGGNQPTSDQQDEPAPSATYASPQLSARPDLYADTGAPQWGGAGMPMGYFPAGTSGPGPLSNLNPSGITWQDVLASGVKPRYTSGTVPAPGGIAGNFGGWGGDLGHFSGPFARENLQKIHALRGRAINYGSHFLEPLSQFASHLHNPGANQFLGAPIVNWSLPGGQGASTQKPGGGAGATTGGGPGGIA